MKLVLAPQASADLTHWIKTNPKLAVKIVELMEACRTEPFSGVGKPEPLKHDFKGLWSRRVDDEHRLIYRVSGKGDEQTIEIASCRFHYARR